MMTDANVRESKVEIAVGGLEHTGVMLTIPCGSDTTVVDRWTDGRWPDTVGIAIARQDTDPDHGTTYRSASLILDRETALRLSRILHDIALEADHGTAE